VQFWKRGELTAPPLPPPPPPPTAQTLTAFSASQGTITAGDSVVLAWETANATAVRLNGAVVALSGTLTAMPTQTTTYTLEVDGSAPTLSQQLVVTVTAVQPPPPPPATSSQLLRIGPGRDFPSWDMAHFYWKIRWENPGGDWYDRSFTKQGANSWAVLNVTAPAPVDTETDVTDLVNAMLEKPEYDAAMIIRMLKGMARIALSESGNGPALVITDTAGTTKTLMPLVDGALDVSAYAQSTAVDVAIGTSRGVIKWGLDGLTRATKATLKLRMTYAYTLPFAAAIDLLRTPALNFDPAATETPQRGIADTVASDGDLRSHPDVLHYIPMDSYAAFQAAALATGPGTPYLGHPEPYGGVRNEFHTWPDGIPYARIFFGTNMAIATAHFWSCEPKPSAPLPWQFHCDQPKYQELFYRQLYTIGEDVMTGINPIENGVKMPGMAADHPIGWDGTDAYLASKTPPYPAGYLYAHGWEARVDHMMPSAVNPQIYPMATYWYGGDWPQSEYSGNGRLRYWKFQVKAGRRYCREQRVRLNTSRPCTLDEFKTMGAIVPNVGGTQAIREGAFRKLIWAPNAPGATDGLLWLNDGVLEEYLDGVLAYRDDKVPVRSNEWATFELLPYFNFYHGGMSSPVGVGHYDTGGHVVAKKYIGPPKG
jgi:hypothetical protein